MDGQLLNQKHVGTVTNCYEPGLEATHTRIHTQICTG